MDNRKVLDIMGKLSVPQSEFLKRSDDPLLIFQAGVGSGKTFVASIYLIANMLKGRRMVAGALNHQALMKTLFRQTFDLAWKWGLDPKINKQDKTIQVGKGVTFGYSNDAPDSVLGLSDIYGLVLDEASRCCELFYNNLSDRLRGHGVDKPYKRLITSPCNEPSAAWFNNLCATHPEAVIRAPLLSNPFVSKEYIRELTERYGVGTPLYRQQVLGELVSTDFLNAILKDEDFGEAGTPMSWDNQTYMGMDVAGLGRDNNCLAVVCSKGLIDLKVVRNLDTMGKETLVTQSFNNFKWYEGDIDATGGYSEGLYDSLKHNPRLNLKMITFSEKPTNPIYRNIRSQMYCELADAIRNGFYIDRDIYPMAVEELRNTQVFIDERGLLRIIPKEDIKKLIGRSPDTADAIALAVFAMNHGVRHDAARVLSNIQSFNNIGYFNV